MIRVLFFLLCFLFIIGLLYIIINAGVYYFPKIFPFKKFVFHLFEAVNEVNDHVTQPVEPKPVIKFHSPKLLEFGFLGLQYPLLSGLSYTCDIPLEKRFLNYTSNKETTTNIILFTNQISETFSQEPVDEIPDDLTNLLNVYCLEKKFEKFNDEVVRKFLQIFSNEILGKTDRSNLAKYDRFCQTSIAGWITPNAFLHAYSYAVNLINVVKDHVGPLVNSSNTFIHIESSLKTRVDLYSRFVYSAMKYALIIKMDKPTLYNQLIKKGLFDFETEDYFDMLSYSNNANANFCAFKDYNSCQCPRLRLLHNLVGQEISHVLNSAEPDLKMVHDLLLKISSNSMEKPNFLALHQLLLEYSATDLTWLKSVLNMFLYEVCNSFKVVRESGQYSEINSVNALNKDLICQEKSTLDNSPISDHYKSNKCIPQEIISWIWKADITLEDFYFNNKEYTKYTKLIMFPFLMRLNEIGESSFLESKKLQMHLFGMNPELMKYVIKALDIEYKSGKKTAQPDPTTINFFLRTINNEIYFSIIIDNVNYTEKLAFCVTHEDKSLCRFSDFSSYLKSPTGYWFNFNQKKISNLTNAFEFHRNLCI